MYSPAYAVQKAKENPFTPKTLPLLRQDEDSLGTKAARSSPIVEVTRLLAWLVSRISAENIESHFNGSNL